MLLCIAGTLLNSDFATLDNAMNVLTRTAFIGIIAVGMCFVIIGGGIDLSVGSMAALIAGSVILLMNALAAAPRLLPRRSCGLGIGGFAPVLGALFGLRARPADHQGPHRAVHRHARHAGHLPRLPHLLADGGAITLDNDAGRRLQPGLLRAPARRAGADLGLPASSPSPAPDPESAPRYRPLRAGDRLERAGRALRGVAVDRVKILTYVLLGVCVGVATLLYVPRLGSASPTTGLLWELEAIAAVIVGGTALKGGAGSVTGTVIGAVLLSVIGNILNLTSIISVYLNAAVQGVVIISSPSCSAAVNPAARSQARGCALPLLHDGGDNHEQSFDPAPADRWRRGGSWPPRRVALRRHKVNLGVAIPTATHGFTGGIVWWANQAKKDLEKQHPGSEGHRQDGRPTPASRPTSCRTC